MYESPVEMIQKQMQNKIEDDVLKILMNYDIKVDKNELIRALQYDRNQYEKGYADAKSELVRCKDCIYRGDYLCPMFHTEQYEYEDDGYFESGVIEHDNTVDHGFCHLGERDD